MRFNVSSTSVACKSKNIVSGNSKCLNIRQNTYHNLVLNYLTVVKQIVRPRTSTVNPLFQDNELALEIEELIS